MNNHCIALQNTLMLAELLMYIQIVVKFIICSY